MLTSLHILSQAEPVKGAIDQSVLEDQVDLGL
jgi:hypothetical protein